MTANYLTLAYVQDRIGTDELNAMFWDNEDSAFVLAKFTAAVEDASELVKGLARTHARNSSGELGDTTTDRNVMLATFGAFYAAMCMRPEVTVELPADWDANPAAIALRAVRDGKLQFSTEIDPTIADAQKWTSVVTNPQRTSRTEIGGL